MSIQLPPALANWEQGDDSEGGEPPESPATTLTLRAQNWDDRGRADVTLESARGELLHRDRLDPASASQRKRFLDALAKAHPLSGPEREELARRLSALHKPDATAVPIDQDQIRPENIVRPGLFWHPDVCGVLVYRTAQSPEGDAIARPSLALRWNDGRRECKPFASVLELPGNARLLITPRPGDANPKCFEWEWSHDAQARWLGGQSAPGADALFERLIGLVESSLHLSATPEEADGWRITIALFAMLTYLAPGFHTVPYLHAHGPKGSGKSEVLRLLDRVAFRPIAAASATAAVIFRTIDAQGGTLLLDEAEKLNTPSEGTAELLGILLAGYKRGTPARRCSGDDHEVRSFDVFGPKAFASIRELPEALASRSLHLPMLRKPKGTRLPRFKDSTADIRNQLHALSLEHGSELAQRWRILPEFEGIENRDAEIWGPLLAIAAWIDERWHTTYLPRLHAHARRIVESSAELVNDQAHEAILETLLHFAEDSTKRGDVTAKEILAALRHDDEDEWRKWSPRGIGKVLRGYSLAPTKIGGRVTFKLHDAKAIYEVMDRYGMGKDNTPEGTYAGTSLAPTYPDSTHNPAPASTREHRDGHIVDIGYVPTTATGTTPPPSDRERGEI